MEIHWCDLDQLSQNDLIASSVSSSVWLIDLVYLLQQQHAEFPPAVFQPESVCAVHHPHQPVCALEVVSPVGAQGLLTPYIPNIQPKPRTYTDVTATRGLWTARLSSLYVIARTRYPLCSRVLMLKPSVGEMVLTSSPLNFFRMVVFPALSKPLQEPG